jgi:phosphatidate cytidylyltransferase
MKRLIQRLLIFVIGLPLMAGIVLLLPQRNHLALNILAVLFSGLGALEFTRILEKKGIAVHPAEALILGILGPASMTAVSSFGLEGPILPLVFTLGGIWLFSSRIFASPEGLDRYTTRIAGGFSVMIYPGLFILWVGRMTTLPQAGPAILVFLLMVFANDSAAWALGNLLGKGNRGLVKASPNKSIAGFAGGIAASILVGLGADLFPAFGPGRLPPPAAGLITGFCTGAAAILGDLAESAMKRSSGIKDSGVLIPGRGGVLDTIDSIALAAPVYYLLYRLFYV